jgi:hypothetical protein
MGLLFVVVMVFWLKGCFSFHLYDEPDWAFRTSIHSIAVASGIVGFFLDIKDELPSNGRIRHLLTLQVRQSSQRYLVS